jgi:hypothetical protein
MRHNGFAPILLVLVAAGFVILGTAGWLYAMKVQPAHERSAHMRVQPTTSGSPFTSLQRYSTSTSSNNVAATKRENNDSPFAGTGEQSPPLLISDFRFAFARDIAGFFPAKLPLYRLGFITDSTGLNNEVSETEAVDLATQLGIPGQVHKAYFRNDSSHKYPEWFAGDGSLDEVYYSWREPTSSRPTGPALAINPTSGSVRYESHTTCGDEANISLQQATDMAREFIASHNIELGETTSTATRPLGDRGCYYVGFSNLLPFDSEEMDNSLIPDGARGLAGVRSPLDYIGQRSKQLFFPC